MCRQVHRDTDTIWSRALPMGRLQGRLGNLLLQRQTGSDCCLQVGFLSRGGTGSFLFLANFASGRHGWSAKCPALNPFVFQVLMIIYCEALLYTACPPPHCLLTPTLIFGSLSLDVISLLSSGQTHLSLDGQSQQRSFWFFLSVFL